MPYFPTLPMFFSNLRRFESVALLLLRLAVGSAFLYHGLMKAPLLTGGMPEGGPTGAMLVIMQILAVVEPLGAIALIIGFLVRPAALGLAIIMIGAIAFKVSGQFGVDMSTFAGYELDVMLLAMNAALLIMGAGAYSLEALLRKK